MKQFNKFKLLNKIKKKYKSKMFQNTKVQDLKI